MTGSVLNSQFLYARALMNALDDGGRVWLDLGCGHQFLPDWMPEDRRRLPLAGRRIVGLDADVPALGRHAHLVHRVGGTVEELPFAGGSFDLATANMVLEHVARPERLFSEVARVLKPGGRFLLHTPNARGYTTRLTRLLPPSTRPAIARALQGREPCDVYPTWYRANRLDQLAQLATGAGFVAEILETVNSSPQLYAVPMLRRIEGRLLRILTRPTLASLRPCILAQFQRIGGHRGHVAGMGARQDAHSFHRQGRGHDYS